MDRPTYATVKHLFAISGNNCAFPNCKEPLVHGEKVTGRICHIKGSKPGAARYDANQTNRERHSFGNLILMSPIHHDVIDADERAYTVERLTVIKSKHEKNSIRRLQLSDRQAEQFFPFLTGVVAPQIATTIFNQNVSSHNRTGGITAHTVVNLAPPRRKLTDELGKKIVEQMPRDKEIVVWFIAGNDETYSLAQEVFTFMRHHGFKVFGEGPCGQMFLSATPKGVSLMGTDDQGRLNLQVGLAE